MLHGSNYVDLIVFPENLWAKASIYHGDLQTSQLLNCENITYLESLATTEFAHIHMNQDLIAIMARHHPTTRPTTFHQKVSFVVM